MNTLRQIRGRSLCTAALFVLTACGGSTSPETTSAPVTPPDNGPVTPQQQTIYSVASGCYAIQSPRSGKYLRKDADGSYQLSAGNAEQATAFRLRATALGRYLLYDPDTEFLSIRDGVALIGDGSALLVDAAGDLLYGVGDTLGILDMLNPIGDIINDVGSAVSGLGTVLAEFSGPNALVQSMGFAWDNAEWTLEEPADDVFTLRSTSMDLLLAAEPNSTGLSLAPQYGSGDGYEQFALTETAGCADFPEAELGANGTPKLLNDDGTVFGYVDSHSHVSAFEFLGGMIESGEPFHRFGVTHALDDCILEHGPLGLTGVVEEALSGKIGHDTRGWPKFPYWPNQHSYAHHQTYYMWIKRAWMGGLRIMVNHLVANELICEIWPIKENDCDEMTNIRLQRQRMYEMQDYIDAQEGGPGKGWFRIVTDPYEARAVIEDGKLAVVLGIEAWKLFGCGLDFNYSRCTTADIDAGIKEFYDLGVRSIFPVVGFNNGFSGAGIYPPSEVLLNVGNLVETGQWLDAMTCPEEGHTANLARIPEVPGDNIIAGAINQVLGYALPIYPEGPHCNPRPLSSLGEYLVSSLMDKGILVETDHLGYTARYQAIEMAEARGMPVISSHSRSGGENTEQQARRIWATGGMVNTLQRDWNVYELIEEMQRQIEFHSDDYYFGLGYGADNNGLALQPAPRPDAAEKPFEYPFTSYDGRVVFDHQITGERVYDINVDGVAHYGLYPDYFADLRNQEGGEEVMKYFYRSAEAYLRMWQRAYEAGTH